MNPCESAHRILHWLLTTHPARYHELAHWLIAWASSTPGGC